VKVLLVSGFFPPEHVAGSEKRTFAYAKCLLDRGHRVQVVCAGTWDSGPGYWNGYQDDLYHSVPVRRLHINWKLAPDPNRFLYENPIVGGYFGQWLEEWNPDVVHVISCYTMSGSIIEAAKAFGCPVVLTLVDFWFVCPRISLLHADGSLCDGGASEWECLRCLLHGAKAYRWPLSVLPEKTVAAWLLWVSQHPSLSKQRGLRGMALNIGHRKAYLQSVIELVDCFIAPSQSLVDVYRSAGVPYPIKVVHSGHDLSWLDEMPLRQPSPVLRFGYIGQITPQKGVDLLVSAFAHSGLSEQARLEIHGDESQFPAYAQRLRSLLDEGQHKHVTFHGSFLPDDLGHELASMDVLVVPSRWRENSPRVIQEAFASNMPVIASDVAGISEFVKHGSSGLLFERGNMADLARQMRRIVKEPALLAQLRAGIPPVKTIEQEVDELIAIYEQLLRNEHRD